LPNGQGQFIVFIHTMKVKVAVILLLMGSTAIFPASGATADISYNRDIRPILSDNCFACHGPDSASRKANLRLDSFEAATAARPDGRPAIVPGKPGESEAILRVLTDDVDEVMPPEKAKKVLSAAQKDLLQRWVSAGAKYEAH
jgi:mono/diheme cytochrome c family protein